MQFSNSVENYLKGIYSLSRDNSDWINTNEVAARLNIKPASVTDMVQKLDQKKFVKYQKYKGVKLTKSGTELALKVIRKHRLWEVFLQDKLGFKWDEVHDIAEQLEHISSPELVSRLESFLNFPKFDPHGDPIPDAQGKMNETKRKLLSDFSPLEQGTLVGVNDSSPEFLQFLNTKSLVLGCHIKVIAQHEYDLSMDINIDTIKTPLNVSKEVSQNLFLTHDE